MQNKISIIIPVFNEEKSIVNVIKNIRIRLPKIEIIVVNDGSTDLTLQKIRNQNVEIINHPECLGYGTALRSGIEFSKKDYVLFCDGDGQHRIEDVEKIIKSCQDFDMVVGARGKDSHQQLNRVFGKAILSYFASLLMGKKVLDLNSGLRIIRRKIINKYLHLMPHGFSFSTTSTFALSKDKRSIKWVPIRTVERIGKSSVRQIKDGTSILLLMLRLSILFEPLKIFMFSSIILFFLTIISFIFNIFLMGELNITDTTVILGLGTLIVFLTGLLCDQVSAIRRNL